jgi:hypothetical protein
MKPKSNETDVHPRQVPGRPSGCPPGPPQIRTCPIKASGSSVMTLLPRRPVRWPALQFAGVLLRRLVSAESLPSFLPANHHVRPRLPSRGSLGSQSPTIIGTVLGYDCPRFIPDRFAHRSLSSTLLFSLIFVSPLEARCRGETHGQRQGLVVSR